MLDGVFVKNYAAPPVDRREILRYAGCKDDADERLNALINECLNESEHVLAYRVCYHMFDVKQILRNVTSQTVKRGLDGCEQAIVFAATVGLDLDRLIARYGATNTAKAVILQAIGAERVEALCDTFCRDLEKEYEKNELYARRRFSPGYGDFALERQKEIFSALDCPKKIGLTLTESGLMSPTKSVTAIMGLQSRKCTEKTGCEACEKADCFARK